MNGIARTTLLSLSLVAAFATASAHAQNGPRGGLLGTVLSDSADKPIANAEVTISELGLADTTDADGDFSFKDVPLGTYTLTIRAERFGMMQTKLTFHANEIMSRDFTLVRATDMRMTIARKGTDVGANRLAEFEARRKTGGGRFLTREVFEKNGGRRSFGDILASSIPGIQLVSNNGERSVATGSRGRITLGAGGADKRCYVQVIFDNIVRYRSAGERLFNVDNIDPNLVEGVEFYTVSQTPSQFNATGSTPCGTMVIWSRN